MKSFLLPTAPSALRQVCQAAALTLSLGGSVVTNCAMAVTSTSEDSPQSRAQATELPTVTVQASRPGDVAIEPDIPTTTIGRQEIQRRQATSIFDLVKDVPGVSVDGGPRASGMKFNIRGFSNNEDVTFKIDGAVKGFEKYRFGSGVFIEPELLKSVEIQRGPSITSGSGALGGTVSATTHSASDLLRPGQKVGAMAKVGYGSNSSERLRMLAAYGRLSGQADLLAAVTTRQSGDIRLANGNRLSASATQSDSTLLKAGWYPSDNLIIELSRVAYSSGPERAPYDATAGEPGVFGIVRRSIDDETINLKFTYEPPESLLRLRGSVSKEQTHLTDLALQSDNRITYIPGNSTKPGAGDITDSWYYDISSAELFNDLEWSAGLLKGTLTLGWQGLHNERMLNRLTQNPTYNNSTGLYPNGFYAAQPPGTKDSTAWIIEHAFNWRDWTLTPGIRWDDYRVKASGGTLALLSKANQSSEVSVRHTTPSLRLTWQANALAKGLSFTLSQADSFRPPLIDEAFTNGAYSRCLKSIGPVHFPLYDTKTQKDLAPDSGICGDLYKPEVSTTREVSASWRPADQVLGVRWQARAAYFDIDTRNLLNSLSAVDGQVEQPGTEHRHGAEFELQMDARRWFGSMSYSRVAGRVDGGALSLTQNYSGPLYTVPGRTISLGMGLRAMDNQMETGIRVRNIGDRLAIVPTQATMCSTPGINVPGLGNIGTQYGVQLIDLYTSYRFSVWTSNDVSLRFGVDNLTNETYCLNDGFGGGVGTQAPGRNAKLQLTWQM